MPSLSGTSRLLARHRRLTAAVGVALVLGVVALDAHAALPEHHHVGGTETVCIAALSVAVLAVAGLWAASRARACVGPRLARSVRVGMPRTGTPRLLVAVARAGPPGPVVLRR